MRAADQLHSTLLETSSVRKVEPAAYSLVQHMWALSDEVWDNKSRQKDSYGKLDRVVCCANVFENSWREKV